MADLFREIIPSILQTKKNCMLTEQDEKSYPAFMVGRAMSQYPDTVLDANYVNMCGHIDNKLKYDFLINKVKPYKRPYVKWHKKAETDDLEVVKEYYGYSTARALEALRILTDDQVKDLRKRIQKGD
jgi:hypothetical protein